MKLQSTLLAQTPEPVPPPSTPLGLSWEGLALVGALFFGVTKWLLGREIKRLDDTLALTEQRLKALEDKQATQQVEAATISRLERELASMERQLVNQAQALALLGKLPETQSRQTEALGELKERVQRADNIGVALVQAQDLIKECQKDLLQFKAQIATGFVTEEKFVRDMTVFASRLDAVWERFDEVTGGRPPRLLTEGDRGYR